MRFQAARLLLHLVVESATKEMHLSTIEQGTVTSSVLFGAAVGAILSSFTSSKYGRRNSLIAGALIFALSSISSAYFNQYHILILSRFILGISVGIATYNAPLYIAEVSPSKIRGTLVTLYQFMITIGILAVFVSDLAFTPSGN